MSSSRMLLPALLLLLLGAIPTHPDEKAALPPTVDLRPTFDSLGLKPRAQRKRNTCSVFVVVQALEYAAGRREGRGCRLSVEYLNWASNDVARNDKDGSFFSDLWKGFEAHGVCSEDALPYRETFAPELVPERDVRRRARKALSLGLRYHWIKEWDPERGLSDPELLGVRRTLARGWPVCGGFLWPKESAWEGDTVRMCARKAVRDGHSVLLVGYVDDPKLPGGGAFRIRNTSGERREGRLTYAYAQAYMNDAAWIDCEDVDGAAPEAEHGASGRDD